MIKVQLCALALAGLLSTAALAGATGPTNPVEGPKSPATQGTPKININPCLLYTSPSPRDKRQSRMPSSA